MSGLVVRRMLDQLNHDELLGTNDIGVGPWQDLVVFGGFTGALRCRLVPAGVQLVGAVSGTMTGAQRQEITQLPVGHRPAVTQILAGTVGPSAGGVAFGAIEVWASDGRSFMQWSVAGAALFYVSAILALD